MGCGKCTELGQMEKAPFPCCAVQKRMFYFYIHWILSLIVALFIWLSHSFSSVPKEKQKHRKKKISKDDFWLWNRIFQLRISNGRKFKASTNSFVTCTLFYIPQQIFISLQSVDLWFLWILCGLFSFLHASLPSLFLQFISFSPLSVFFTLLF